LSDLGTIDLEALETLIQEVSLSGGAETANTQIFIERLTKALKLPTPDFAGEQNEHNDYTFERRVDFKFPDGSTSIGRIDCYKRDCFVLEAKQSSKRKRDTRQLDMLGEDAKQKKLGTAKRGTGGWDKSMRAARKQAENYARALPISHGYPPFLLVLDVGNVLEVYADFSGQGKNYAQFPDRNSYRLSMDDLREADVQERLRKIWQDPQSLNPALISAVVTRDIAERLAKIAKRLESDHDSEVVAHFLMRCLFTMFAEDVKLIEEKSFENLLLELKDNSNELSADAFNKPLLIALVISFSASSMRKEPKPSARVNLKTSKPTNKISPVHQTKSESRPMIFLSIMYLVMIDLAGNKVGLNTS